MMEPEVPTKLRIVAAAQLVAGFINIAIAVVVATSLAAGGGMFTAVVGSLCACPCSIGAVAGVLGLVYFPIAFFEIGIGFFTLLAPARGATPSKILAFFEIGHILIGSVGSLIAGAIVPALLGDDEVTGYLEAQE